MNRADRERRKGRARVAERAALVLRFSTYTEEGGNQLRNDNMMKKTDTAKIASKHKMKARESYQALFSCFSLL